MQRTDSLEKTLMLGKIEGRRRRGGQRMRRLDGITDSVDMVWVDSESWWWTGRPGVLPFMGLQRVRQDWATELKWTTDFLTVRFVKGGSEVSPIKNFEIKVSSDLSAEAEMWSDLDLRLYPKTVGPPSLCDLVLVSGQWRCYIDICKPVERNNSEAGKQSIIGHLFKI